MAKYVWPTVTKALSPNYAGHSGVDIPVGTGNKLFAVAGGVITYVGEGRGYGQAIFLRDEYGINWVYGHGSKQIVKAGDKVKQGQLIGYSGNTGNSSGPHLHIEAAQGGRFNVASNRAYTLALLNGASIPSGSTGGGSTGGGTTTPPVDPKPPTKPVGAAQSVAYFLRTGDGLMAYYKAGDAPMLFAGIGSNKWIPTREQKVMTTTPPVDPSNPVDPSPGGGTGTGSGNAGKYPVTEKAVLAAMKAGNYPVSGAKFKIADIVKSWNDIIAQADPGSLSSKKRTACLIGQTVQETGGFYYMKEYGADGARYAPYVGRGFIQLTWKDNYADFGKYCVAKKIGGVTDPNYFVKNPEVVATKLLFASATSIWQFNYERKISMTLFAYCDTQSSPWYGVSRWINYGTPNTSYTGSSYNLRARCIDAAMAAL